MPLLKDPLGYNCLCSASNKVVEVSMVNISGKISVDAPPQAEVKITYSRSLVDFVGWCGCFLSEVEEHRHAGWSGSSYRWNRYSVDTTSVLDVSISKSWETIFEILPGA